MLINGLQAVVTGGASGLGEATARMLAEAGATVALFDMNSERGNALAAEIGGSFHKVDVSDAAAVAEALNGLDPRICVNCAGIAPGAKTVDRDGNAHNAGLFAKTVGVNLIGTFNVASQCAAKMAAHVDHVLALLPFEPPYMEAAGMSCDFVGHPVVAEPEPDRQKVVKLQKNGPLITLLPGSRMGEINRLAPIFFDVAKQIEGYRFVIPVAGAHLVVPLEQMLRESGLEAELVLPESGLKTAVFAASTLALAASGTVSIELAAVGTPMVIGYKTNWITAAIMRRAMLAPSFTLVNLLTDSKAVPEFEPRDCTVENLLPAMKGLLDDPAAREAQIAVGQQAMLALGKGGEDPGVRAARSVLAQL